MNSHPGRLLVLFCLTGFVLIALLLRSIDTTPENPVAPEQSITETRITRSRDTENHRARLRDPHSNPAPSPDLVHAETLAAPANPPADPDEARQWARENPEQALAWIAAAPAGPERDTVVEIACAKIAESDPAQAVALAERYSGGCTNLLENLVHQWSERDEPAARAYALSKPPGDERGRLLSRVALIQSKTDPRAAAKLVVEQISPGEVQNEAALSVLQQWGSRDPTGAVAWAELFDDGIRDRALHEAGTPVRQSDR